ncbi:hypothetical protein FH972_018180 [Carpinus fangiana]|uniref:Uncharacterized protein n=1 Tax=Carpinus fangiana TaxID=176857 RepID=A0A5N6RNE5_9ROSI|nr:hypothetical protein FH972_018180 [Carpinus fangiana]
MKLSAKFGKRSYHSERVAGAEVFRRSSGLGFRGWRRWSSSSGTHGRGLLGVCVQEEPTASAVTSIDGPVSDPQSDPVLGPDPSEFRKSFLGLRSCLRLTSDANTAPILPTENLPADFGV